LEWRYFAAAVRKNQLKASKLYQFRLDDSPQRTIVVAMQKDSFAVALSHLNDIETEIVIH
jgi:hypothetical protein